MRGVNWFNGLLPSGSAFKLPADSEIRKFFSGLGSAADDVETEAGNIFFDLFPDTTRTLDEWDDQFGIVGPTATVQDRRDRLTSAWRETGGQSPGYIQETLQEAGFDVFVHEASLFQTDLEIQIGMTGIIRVCTPTACTVEIDIGSVGGGSFVGQNIERSLTIRDPRPFIGGFKDFVFGRDDFNNTINVGNLSIGRRSGVVLINELISTAPAALDDTATWPFVWYLGAETFGDFASVSNERKDEFIAKIQKIRPRHTWIVLFVNFG